MSSAERGEAPPAYAESNQEGSSEARRMIDATQETKERQWIKTRFYNNVNVLFATKIHFFLHPILLIGCLVLSASIMLASRTSGRDVVKEDINFLQSLAPILLSLPITLLFCSPANSTEIGAYSIACAAMCYFSHFFLTIITFCTLNEISKIPSKSSGISHPDRSSECINLLVHWMISLMSTNSLRRLGFSLHNMSSTKKFLTAVKWNGSCIEPTYDKTVPIDTAYKMEMIKKEEASLKFYTQVTKFVLFFMACFSLETIIFHLFSMQSLIQSNGDLVFTILTFCVCARGYHRLATKKSLGMAIYILIIVSGWVWQSFIHNGFKSDYNHADYPLVDMIDSNPLSIENASEVNMTGHVASSTAEFVAVVLVWFILSSMNRVFFIFSKMRRLHGK